MVQLVKRMKVYRHSLDFMDVPKIEMLYQKSLNILITVVYFLLLL